jgi:hypothetical protein
VSPFKVGGSSEEETSRDGRIGREDVMKGMSGTIVFIIAILYVEDSAGMVCYVPV